MVMIQDWHIQWQLIFLFTYFSNPSNYQKVCQTDLALLLLKLLFNQNLNEFVRLEKGLMRDLFGESATEVMQNSTNMYSFTNTWNMWHTIQLESTIYSTWCLFCKELTPPPPSPHMAIATPHFLTLLHPYNLTSKQFLLNPPQIFLSFTRSLISLFPHSLFHFPPHSASRQRQAFSERKL